jgi:hypothetical protein
MTNNTTQLSNKSKFYWYIPNISDSCEWAFMKYLKNHFSPNDKFIATTYWEDQSMIPEDIRDRYYWTGTQLSFKDFPQDNLIYVQNIGDIRNTLSHKQIFLFIDEELQPIFEKALEVAREHQKTVKGSAEIKVLICDRNSGNSDLNPIWHYYKDFEVQYPHINWFIPESGEYIQVRDGVEYKM